MRSLRILPFLFCFFLFGCEDFFDCLIAREPSIPDKEFPIASTESFYYVDLTVEIENEPRDDDYDYYFHVRGLPEGLDYFVSYRTISIEGTPLETGINRITIDLDVEGPFRNGFDDDSRELCNYSTSKTFLLIVE
ncbi:hypothetical protein [Winogradskyella sp.]|uniref:hypothetical protein n=1 Tax=Winogradskyella sp. TaxID=1883156 RepID=UPI00263455D0|nr:hypothetical protein [Winogradskyella sp.]